MREFIKIFKTCSTALIVGMPLCHAAHAITCNGVLCPDNNYYCKSVSSSGDTMVATCNECPTTHPLFDTSRGIDTINACYSNCNVAIDLHKPIIQKHYYNQGSCETKNECVENANGPDTSGICTCKAGYKANNEKTDCTPEIYKIELDPNGGEFESGAKSIIYLKYDNAYTDTTPPDFSKPITQAATPKRKNYKFLGYYDAKVGGNEQTPSTGQLRAATSTTTDTTWYAHWEGLPYHICYYGNVPGTDDTNNNSKKSTQCKIGETCTVSSDTLTKNTQYPTIVNNGLVLTNWKYVDNDTKLKPGSALPAEPATVPTSGCAIKLVAETEECPAGYYCTGGAQSECPAGATSAQGAASKNDCFFRSGPGGTQFCDSIGCFYLPADAVYPTKTN